MNPQFVKNPNLVVFQCSSGEYLDIFMLQKQGLSSKKESKIVELLLNDREYCFFCFACEIQIINFLNTVKHIKVKVLWMYISIIILHTKLPI